MKTSLILPSAALLAGGLATRLRPLTDNVPKAMVEVAGEPFIAHQLRLLHRAGVTRIVLCVGYRAEAIRAFVGDGAGYGLSVAYSADGERQLGTGGALRKALPLLGKHFFVTYADSYLDIDYPRVYRAFGDSGRLGLMTVFRNLGQWDTSNVDFANGTIRRYDKRAPTPDMQYIDYGLGVLTAAALEPWPQDEPVDLAEIYQDLLGRGELAGFEVANRFYEVGSPAGLVETDQYLRAARAEKR